MLDRISDYNWKEAFCLAQPPKPVDGYNGSVDLFAREDVEHVVAAEDGENEGDSWEGVFRLKDGRFVFVSAWCDYTGWGYQDGGHSWVASNLPSLIRFGLTSDARDRLKLPLTDLA